jgi:predicted dehydrogenase
MDEIRIAVVGLGNRGVRSWIPNLLKLQGYQIVAICDPIKELHARALAQLPRPQEVAVYSEYAEVLAADNIDAVALCVRCLEQGALAAQALEAGKHVHAEVPAAHTLEDCWRIVTAVERTGLVYSLAEQTRYYGFVEAWQEIVARGELGKVTYAEGQYIGFYGTRHFFQNPDSGEFCEVEKLPSNPKARPTAFQSMAPIHYLPHELSPMLKILDDRVVEVTAMSTRPTSYSYPEIAQPDIQVALMKTAKDTLLRLAAGFTQPVPSARGHHWYQLIGTRGCVEWKRAARDLPKMWLANRHMQDMAEVDWQFQRTDAPPEARGSGHGDADIYPHLAFRDAVLGRRPLDFDVYKAIETAAPAIRAADSIAQSAQPMKIPDFRPGEKRRAGECPVGQLQ